MNGRSSVMTSDKDEFELEAEAAEELDEEESYIAYIYDAKEDEDFKDYDLPETDDERPIWWDGADYEYYETSATVPTYDDLD